MRLAPHVSQSPTDVYTGPGQSGLAYHMLGPGMLVEVHPSDAQLFIGMGYIVTGQDSGMAPGTVRPVVQVGGRT